MSSINVLSEEVYRRIAAGEVIDRPKAVVRELLDNALDASADTIDLSIVRGGLDFISVADNGIGMSKEDLQKCTLSHATSKIQHIEDLSKIQSLGFRGEALASIASVGKLHIVSTHEQETWQLHAQDSKITEISAAVRNKGTLVELSDLFHNMPARKKFITHPQSESQLIRYCFTETAAIYPQTAFRFSVSKDLKLFYPKETKELRLGRLFPDIDPSFFSFAQADTTHAHIEILMGMPEVHYSTRKHIRLYINGRAISHLRLVRAVEHAYSPVMHGGTFPYICIVITIDPELIDVNIHPAKREVHIRNTDVLCRDIVEVIRSKLHNIAALEVPMHSSTQNPHSFSHASLSKRTHDSHSPPSHSPHNSSFSYSPQPTLHAEVQERIATLFHTKDEDIFSQDTKDDIMVYGVVYRTFIAVQYRDTFYLVDFHASNERILFDKFSGTGIEEYDKYGKNVAEQLLLPEAILLSEKEKDIIRPLLKEYEHIGIHIDDSEDVWKITATPATWKDSVSVLAEILPQMESEPASLAQKLYEKMACRSAIKAGDNIDLRTAEELVREVFALKEPRCPHGRPLWIALPKNEMLKQIGRL